MNPVAIQKHLNMHDKSALFQGGFGSTLWAYERITGAGNFLGDDQHASTLMAAPPQLTAPVNAPPLTTAPANAPPQFSAPVTPLASAPTVSGENNPNEKIMDLDYGTAERNSCNAAEGDDLRLGEPDASWNGLDEAQIKGEPCVNDFVSDVVNQAKDAKLKGSACSCTVDSLLARVNNVSSPLVHKKYLKALTLQEIPTIIQRLNEVALFSANCVYSRHSVARMLDDGAALNQAVEDLGRARQAGKSRFILASGPRQVVIADI